MKCPNCGLEVVIATDLCPQCGYRYDFDGSILPKSEPTARESGERHEGRSRRERRGEAGGADRWTAAGVFKDAAGKYGDYRQEDFARQPSAEQARHHNEASREPGMKWYNAVNLAILPIMCVLYLTRGISRIYDGAKGLVYNYGQYYEYMPPWLNILKICTAVVFIICAVMAVKAMKDMKAMRRSGPQLYLGALALATAAEYVYDIAWYYVLLGPYVLGYYSVMPSIIGVIIFFVLNILYFRKRQDLLQ